MTETSPSEWLSLVTRMETDDKLFSQWLINYNQGCSDGCELWGRRK